ncbi:MAG: class I SAM-dependent methyltransferase [Candidatus Pelagibacter sp.]|nr:class I SAM-dependent methyltransferase [Candidatus Pelagibacter sp.]|tara:strand:+ start:183 stop:980 length:798 start_codon:yes stop_codon:yes gene_type:complete
MNKKIPLDIANLPIYKSFKKSPYNSTKHLSYFHTYSELLNKYRDKKITFVEVGILDGGSLFMWRDFFGKKARIIGVEFNPAAKKWEKDGFEIFIGSQSDEKFWDHFFKKIGSVDIILDDGGHTNEQQIVTAHKCIPFIKDGGLLIVEDTHTSYMTKFGNPSNYSFIEWSKKIVDNINSRCQGISISELIYKRYVHSVRFFESIVCFEIDRMKAIDSLPIENGGEVFNTKDFKLKNTSLENAIFKSRYRFWLYFRLQNLKLKRFFR